MTADLSVVMTLAFYPRGGSAQVARYLAAALRQCGTDVTLCSGSLGPEGSETNARTFFAGLNTETVDFTAALEAFAEGRDPMAVEVPIHPSFEDRPDVPDRIFAKLDDDEYRRLNSELKAQVPAQEKQEGETGKSESIPD